MPVKTTLKEHGTAGRYWQGCRCQPCRDAVNEHVKALKAKREGKPATQGNAVQHHRATNPAPVRKPEPVHKKASKSTCRARTLSSIAGEIQVLRSQLARAEAEFARAVSAVLPNHKVTEASR